MKLKCKGVCKDIYKRSQSPAFKNIEIGDIIEFSTEIKAVGRNRGTYATYIKCVNHHTLEESKLSFNQIGRVLGNFEFEEVD